MNYIHQLKITEELLYKMEDDLLKAGWTVVKPYEISLQGRTYTEWRAPKGSCLLVMGTSTAYQEMIMRKNNK